eukprot:6492081-Amphidinium_carterae.3
MQLSNQQRAMWFRIEGQCSTWIRLGSGPRSGLGRSLRKFASLTSVVDELGSALHDLGSTDQYVQSFNEGAPSRGKSIVPDCKVSNSISPARVVSASRTVAQPIVADRLRFKHVPSFDAAVRVHASRRELLCIFDVWDRVGCFN